MNKLKLRLKGESRYTDVTKHSVIREAYKKYAKSVMASNPETKDLSPFDFLAGFHTGVKRYMEEVEDEFKSLINVMQQNTYDQTLIDHVKRSRDELLGNNS